MTAETNHQDLVTFDMPSLAAEAIQLDDAGMLREMAGRSDYCFLIQTIKRGRGSTWRVTCDRKIAYRIMDDAKDRGEGKAGGWEYDPPSWAPACRRAAENIRRVLINAEASSPAATP